MKRALLLILILSLIIPTIQSQNQLHIPPLDSGTWIGGVRSFNLLMKNDSTEFLPGIKTTTAGYNGTFLGPTLFIHKGDNVELNVTNQLGEITTTHWHGLHVPAVMDGGPHQMIADNSSWTATFTMLNEASTFWYHPHHKPRFWRDNDGTGGQVFRGLAGMMIVEDDNNDTLRIPNTYGVDEIPLIVQDRAFDQDGEFIEFLNPALAGRPGDTVLVNGTLNAVLQTHAQMIRFRILNASNTRTYYFGISGNRKFYQIASDGGFLESPILLDRLRISPAERAELVIDFSNDQGQTVNLMSYASELVPIQPVFVPPLMDGLDTLDYKIMSFEIGAPTVTPAPVFSMSQALNSIPVYNEMDSDVSRTFVLSNGPPMSINGATMDMNVINETIQLGDLEVWTIINESGSSHPFHVHGAPFQVLERSDGPVPDSEKGWKDVVFVPLQSPGNPGWVRIIKPFEDFTDSVFPYMYHCHILEHEDRGMMGQYTVVDTASNPTLIEKVNENLTDINLFPNPVDNQNIQLTFWSKKPDIVSIQLFNQFGQIITTVSQNRQIGTGHQEFNFSLSKYPQGIYFLSIQTEQDQVIRRIIKL